MRECQQYGDVQRSTRLALRRRSATATGGSGGGAGWLKCRRRRRRRDRVARRNVQWFGRRIIVRERERGYGGQCPLRGAGGMAAMRTRAARRRPRQWERTSSASAIWGRWHHGGSVGGTAAARRRRPMHWREAAGTASRQRDGIGAEDGAAGGDATAGSTATSGRTTLGRPQTQRAARAAEAFGGRWRDGGRQCVVGGGGRAIAKAVATGGAGGAGVSRSFGRRECDVERRDRERRVGASAVDRRGIERRRPVHRDDQSGRRERSVHGCGPGRRYGDDQRDRTGRRWSGLRQPWPDRLRLLDRTSPIRPMQRR